MERNYAETAEKFLLTKKHLKQIYLALNEPVNEEELESKIVTLPEIMARYIDKVEDADIFEDEFQK